MSGKRGALEGSIYRRRDGYWCGAVSLENWKRQIVYAKTQSDAARKVRAMVKAREDARLPRAAASRLGLTSPSGSRAPAPRCAARRSDATSSSSAST